MKFIKTKKGISLLAVLAVVAISAVGAYAYWTTSGSGSGTATAGDVVGITVNQTSNISGMYPGDAPQPLSGNFTNTNPGNAYVTSVTASLASVTGGAADPSKPACTVADFQLNNATTAVGQDITPGAGNGSWSGPSIQLLDRSDVTPGDGNQDNCKNATLHISYTSA